MKNPMGLLVCLLVAGSVRAGVLSHLLPGTTQSEVARIASPDGQSVAVVTLKERRGLWIPGPEPPKTLARWVRLRVTRDAKTVYDSADEELNVYQTGAFASDLAWSPDSARVAYRYIATLCIVGLDGRRTAYRSDPAGSAIASFRWIDSENLLVVSKTGTYPPDMHGTPHYYHGYTGQAKEIRIGRLNLSQGFTEYHRQPVSGPTFLFHSVAFCLDEISPNADRVAFSDGSNLCIYDVTTAGLAASIAIPQKRAPKPEPTAPGMEGSTTTPTADEMASGPGQLEGVWWPTNDTVVLGVGLLGGPAKAFYVCDLRGGTLTDKTETLLPLWAGSSSAMNYQDPDWYRSGLR